MSDLDAIREHLKYYRDLGVMGTTTDPKWRARRTEAGSAHPSAESAIAEAGVEASATAGGGLEDSAAALTAIRDFIGLCTRYKLSGLGRKTVVFGTGDPNADLMFVGEAPGADEDEQGVPFVGRAGQLLTKIIEAIGMRRDDVYIANVIKCRPPGNRNPEPDEVSTCEPFLAQQIDIVKPRVIVALGTFAAHLLLRTDAPISRIRGVVHQYRGASLIPTFHPAYLLRSPDRKRDVWDDMKKVRALLTDTP
ncbi:MAG TPA: uracil-DNA glycosylase [Vicinamibacterales bacterium]|nr:uracil-DNA glycosylase [Vicinamibacterales bacterium]